LVDMEFMVLEHMEVLPTLAMALEALASMG